MKYLVTLVILIGLGKVVWDMNADSGSDQTAKPELIIPQLSAVEIAGKVIFETNCASCHGVNAVGVEAAGPPLIHKIYEPSHHADFAFFAAVKNGVRPHHWRFGMMPKQPQVSEADVQKIISYIRKLQRANGIE